MYSARALLNDPVHLERFYTRVAPLYDKKMRQCDSAVLRNTQQNSAQFQFDEAIHRRRTAQLFISQQTFHNLEHLQKYFSLVLSTPFEWPVESLGHIVNTRQDLVHRNGVSKGDEPVPICSWDLENAVNDVRAFIDAVALTLRRESS